MGMSIIHAEKLGYDYVQYDEDEGKEPEVVHAVRDVDLKVERGQFIAILGHNGSGKSTLAKHINALLVPTEGTIYIDHMDTRDDDSLWKIRQEAGMVFQNPDNQIVASVVEEDVGFGPENLGVPTDEIWRRVDDSLAKTGMIAYRKHSPNKLSGGQKQRVAIAGVMAMKPKCIVLDEPTAMLDPNGRKEVIKAVRDLNKAEHVTVILITHYMEEVTGADRIFVMDAGELVMEGTPVEIFSQVEKLRKLRLDVPQVTELAYELKQSGAELPDGILTTDELVHHLCEEKNPIADPKKLEESLQEDIAAESEVREKPQQKNQTAGDGEPEKVQPEKLDIEGGKPEIQAQEDKHTESGGRESLRLEHVSYVYSTGTAYEITALKDVSLEIPKGQFVGIIGHTGSGKSTLVQHFNGLIRPTSGHVYFQGRDIWEEGYPLRELRFHVGLVFQYPEYQLFETDVIKDVCFGPKNQGLSEEDQMKRAREALRQVGIPEGLYEKSPFELSGGQKRRVAIAGVLAMNPDILVLDEPTAGLDPRGREEILSELDQLQKERGITVILVSHSMEDVAQHVDRIIAMNKGEVAFDGTPRQVFSHYKELETMGLAAPQMTYIMHALRKHGLDVDVNASTLEEARRTVLQALKEKTA